MCAKVDAAILRVILIVFSGLIIISLWGFYSSIRPPKIISTLTPRDLKMNYEDVSFKTADGLTLRGWFIPGTRVNERTLILLHGYPADKGNILPALSFLHEDYNLLLFDFRYLGESEGNYSTVGAKEVEDLLAAIQFLKSRGVREVGVWGFSMGGAVALMTIEKAPEIKAVISESSYASLADMTFELLRIPVLNYPIAYLVGFWAKLFLGIDVRDASPANRIRNTKIPTLLIHSSADAVIPFSHARRLQKALENNPNAESWFHEQYAHGQLASDYRNGVKNFFLKHLSENGS